MMKRNKNNIKSCSIKEKIYLLKHGKRLNIKVIFGKVNYFLLLISDQHELDKQLIKLLALWRKQHEHWFPAIFPVTLEGTKRWLRDKVINEPGRILFMIKVKNQYIGHIGLYRFNSQNNSCEIDNIVRGVNRYPGIMENAISHLMRWGQTEFGIKTFMLSTASDNKKALRLYLRLGFFEVKRLPMIRIIKSDRIEWQNAPKEYTGIIKRHNIIMKRPYE
jgi:RimJ/RimL family protein N-acetyltransferase